MLGCYNYSCYICGIININCMKEKIEKLIKEVGINEVESILNEIKSKVDVKENLKNDFIDLLSGCTITFDGDDIDYRQDEKLLFYYGKKDNIFGVRKKIWNDFECNYKLEHYQIHNLLKNIVEEVLNYKNVTPVLVLV